MKRLMIVVVVLALAAPLAMAQNRDRIPDLEQTCNAQYAICYPSNDPANGANVTASGWGTAWTGYYGGKSYSKFRLVWAPGASDTPDLAGRWADCKMPGLFNQTAKKIRLSILSGQANDDVCVFVDVAAGTLLVGCKTLGGGGETWVTKDFDIPVGAVAKGQDIKVTVMATGNAWSGFGTYGQVAVESIEVLY